MERLITQNNAWGILKIQVVSGVIQIAIDNRPVYACSEEQSQDIARFLAEQFIDNGAAERDALRSQISQLHAQINEMTETVLRVESERDAFQQIALAKGGSDV